MKSTGIDKTPYNKTATVQRKSGKRPPAEKPTAGGTKDKERAGVRHGIPALFALYADCETLRNVPECPTIEFMRFTVNLPH